MFNRGRCYAAKGDHDRAISEYNESINLSQQVPSVYKWRAYSYECKGDLEHALADLNLVAETWPHDVWVYHFRWNVLMQNNDLEGALADANRLVRLTPRESWSYVYRAIVEALASDDRALAIADMDKAIALEPRLTPYYAIRCVLNARRTTFHHACRDFALFVLLQDRTEYRFVCGLDWEGGRYFVGFYWWPRHGSGQATPNQHMSEINRKCFQTGIEHLLAARFGSSG